MIRIAAGIVSDSAELFLVDMKLQGETPFERLGFAKTQLTNWMPWTFWLLGIGSIAYGFWKRRSIGVMAFFWWPAVYLTVGTTSISSYVPPTIQGRYYAIVILPAALMTAAVAAALVQRWQDSERPGWIHRVGPRMVVALILTVVCIRELRPNLSRGGIYRVPEVRAFTAAIELARERYPEYPVVVSGYYHHRMKPLVDQLPELSPAGSKPEPPYVYLEVVRNVTPKLRRGLSKKVNAEQVAEVKPPASRGAILRDALRRTFSVNRRKQIPVRNTDEGVAVFVMTRKSPPAAAPPAAAAGSAAPP